MTKQIGIKIDTLKTLKYVNDKKEKIYEYKIKKTPINIDVTINYLLGKNTISSNCWVRKVYNTIFYPKKGRLKANLSFKENGKVLVNPWLIPNGNGGYKARDTIYFFQLKNRHSLKIPFRQWSFNALSVPLKVRFGEKAEWTTGANLGVLLGYTWGITNFLHQKEIGNKQYDSKWTFGGFLGASELTFTSNSGQDIGTALISYGIGLLYSYQNFTVGLTGGFDSALGHNRKEWEYHEKPWLGFTLGYSLFSF